MMECVQTLWKQMINFLFPLRCICCGRMLDTDAEISLCNQCHPVVFTRYVEPRAFEKKFFDRVYCVADYTGHVRRAVLKYKFGNARYLANTFGTLIAERIQKNVPKTAFDLVTCVPLSPGRLKERGFNQSADIAKVVANIFGIPFEPDMLIKVKELSPLSKMPAAERRKRVRGAYRFCENCEITKKRILLIDDIYTTGATIDECAKVLCMYGAASVTAAAMCAAVHKISR